MYFWNFYHKTACIYILRSFLHSLILIIVIHFIVLCLDSPKDSLSLKSRITEVLGNFLTKEYLKNFQKYLERMQLCINGRVDYFEHLII